MPLEGTPSQPPHLTADIDALNHEILYKFIPKHFKYMYIDSQMADLDLYKKIETDTVVDDLLAEEIRLSPAREPS